MNKIYETDEIININEDDINIIITNNSFELFNYYAKSIKSIVIIPSTLEEVKLGKEHNNSILMILDTSIISDNEIKTFSDEFFNEPFSGDKRHIDRINKMEKLWK